jgi:hypothetical protein
MPSILATKHEIMIKERSKVSGHTLSYVKLSKQAGPDISQVHYSSREKQRSHT